VQADVLGPLPGEGGWSTCCSPTATSVSGDPVRLLRRAARLLRPGGTVLVELDPAGAGLWRGEARVRCRDDVGRAFPWATAGMSALPLLARASGLQVTAAYRGRRGFAELVDRGR
jgi:hypothetical protein